MMGAYGAAVALLQRAADGHRRIGSPPDRLAASLNNLAMVRRMAGDYANAEPSLLEAIALLERGDDPVNLARMLNNLGGMYNDMGRPGDAEAPCRRALEIRRRALGDRHPEVANGLNTLGLVLERQGRLALAEPLYREAVGIWRGAGADHGNDLAISLDNLATLSRQLGNDAEAEGLLREAVGIWRSSPDVHQHDLAIGLDNLAELRRQRGDLAEAEALLREAGALLRRLLGEGHRDVATNLGNLSMVCADAGRFDEAEDLQRRSAEITRAALGERHPQYATRLHNLAGLARDRGDYAAAEPLYRQALEILRAAVGERHPDVAETLSMLAAALVPAGRAGEALDLLRQAAAIDDWMIGQVFAATSERRRMAYLASVQFNTDLFLSLVLGHLAGERAAVGAACDLVLRRKAIGAEALAAQRDAVLGGRYPGLGPRLRRLAELRTRIVQQALAGPGPEGAVAHRRALAERVAEREALEAELAAAIPEMNLEQRLRAVDRSAVAQALPEGAALIEFARVRIRDFLAVRARGGRAWAAARYAAFVIPDGAPDDVQLVDLGPAGPVDAMIASHRAWLTGESADDARGAGRTMAGVEPADRGGALRAALIDPLASGIGERRRLFIAPDGDLSRLPFEILPAPDGARLIETHHVSYVSAGRDVLRFGAPGAAGAGPPLVVADPDFDLASASQAPADAAQAPTGSAGARQSRDLDREHLVFGRLQHTRVEGLEIAALLGLPPWLGPEVLEARLKACRAPRILHLATHGFFLADPERAAGAALRDGREGRLSGAGFENPLLRAGLALAGANTWLAGRPAPPEAEDGLLTAEDVSGLDLLGTELVVLSACETGLGEVRTGEGVFGLRRAFVLAGARTLVMSLWRVPDRQTAELMADLYRRVLAGEPRALALRAAQLALKARYDDPYYWGAFICQGDPGPLPGA